MGKFLAALVLGVAIFGVVYWAFFDTGANVTTYVNSGSYAATSVTPESELGPDLYPATPFPEVKANSAAARATDPIVISGYLTALDQQEVPSQVPGQMLFIGEGIPDAIVQLAGVAAFMAEPCYYANIWPGDKPIAKFYRRFYENQVVRQDQELGVVDYTKALGVVLEKKAKVNAALAEERAAKYGAEEGDARFQRAKNMLSAIAQEELGEKKLTAIKLQEEYVAKSAAVSVARTDELQAQINLHQHEIRNKLPYKHSIIKSIQRPRGYAVKELEPIMQLQNLDRLLAEAQLDSSYRERLHQEMTATIEPSQEQAAAKRLQGHRKDVTCVAVSKDANKPLIVSGGDDGMLCIWTRTSGRPLRAIQHADPVQSVACTFGAANKNIAAVGLADGAIYFWDLDSESEKPLQMIPRDKAHNGGIASIAFSPDGKYFATGGVDGSIKLWVTESGQERYPFDSGHGVTSGHQDAVTSLTFLPECRLVSAARDQTLRVWKLKEKGAVLQKNGEITGRDGKVTQLGVSRDGRYMLFDQGRTLQLLSVEKGSPIYTVQSPGGSTPFETLAQFSPDGSLMLTAGAAEGRLQLWHTPTESTRGFEVRQFVNPERWAVTTAAFSPAAGQGGDNSFVVSASKHTLYIYPVPGVEEVKSHRIENVRLTLISQNLDAATRQMRIGFEVSNPHGRLIPGRPVTIVID
jgi:WD40 repeat protein